MSAENVELVKRGLEEAFNQGNLDIVDQLFAPRLTELVREGIKQRRAAFPDLTYTVEEITDENDRVGFRYTARGTHKGEFEGIAPTGKTVSWCGTAIASVEGGQVVDVQLTEDRLSRMVQMGRLPKREKPEEADVTGGWQGSHEGISVTLHLTQQNQKVRGTVAVSGLRAIHEVTGVNDYPSIFLEGRVENLNLGFRGEQTSDTQIRGELSLPGMSIPVTLNRT
ncbi:MAG: ester cyclase [Ardenticatenaceae bacterium]|nr:ester cyclase [Ardenticatenaceae bacterium]HBY92988.1 hypothetical protein [Chloroflexota bacterium]